MTRKRNYQDLLDAAYAFAPFTCKDVIHTDDPRNADVKKVCMVCGKHPLVRLYQALDRTGTTWYMGSSCWAEISNRQFREKLHGNT